MAAMPARGGERAQRALVRAQQHPAGARLDRALGARRRGVLAAAETDPAGKDVGLLPCEDGVVDVGQPGQHARRSRAVG